MRGREAAPGKHANHAAESGEAAPVGKATRAMATDAAAADPVAEVKAAADKGHASHALDLMAKHDDAQQAAIADGIGPQARHAFAKHMPHDVGDHAKHRHTALILFQHTPDAELPSLELFVEARFKLNFGGSPTGGGGKKWDALGLRRMWTVLEALPPDHVAHNWAVAKVERYQDTDDKDPNHGHGSFGYALGGAGEIDLSYKDSIIENGGTTDHDQEGDALHGVNRFDEVARHEVGHAVDRELGLPSFNTLMETAEAGHWHYAFEHQSYAKLAQELVTKSNGPIHHLPAHERHRVLEAIIHTMEHSSTAKFNAVVHSIHGHGDLTHDPVYHVMNKARASDDPWKNNVAIAGRHYHEAYAGAPDKKGSGAQWVSYDAKARSSHRVSEYQFRAPQEWFAECYAAFYTPGEAGSEKGSRLKGALPKTHAWFKTYVDDKQMVKREVKRAKKYDGAPRKK